MIDKNIVVKYIPVLLSEKPSNMYFNKYSCKWQKVNNTLSYLPASFRNRGITSVRWVMSTLDEATYQSAKQEENLNMLRAQLDRINLINDYVSIELYKRYTKDLDEEQVEAFKFDLCGVNNQVVKDYDQQIKDEDELFNKIVKDLQDELEHTFP